MATPPVTPPHPRRIFVLAQAEDSGLRHHRHAVQHQRVREAASLPPDAAGNASAGQAGMIAAWHLYRKPHHP